MAERKKNDEKRTDPAAEVTPEAGPAETPVATAPDPLRAPAPAVPSPVFGARRGLLGRAKPAPAPIAALASATGTSLLVLAALQAAHGWTERTRVTRAEFLRLRDEWLQQPANEV